MTGLPLSALAARLTGRVVVPGDIEFERRATPWNVAVSTRPAAVVVAADAADVARTVSFAGTAGYTVQARGTGHGALTEDLSRTLLISTAELDTVEVYDGWVRAGAGTRWADVIAAGAAEGIAPLGGSAPGIGVAGFLTGGGIGPLARTFGVSADHVRSFEVVTGDGAIRRASAAEEPSLFWGLRGGKGALGIVTSIEFDAPRLSEVYAGCAFFSAADAVGVLGWWRGWSADLPDAATTSIAFNRLPAMPGVPEPLAGKTTVAVRFAWVGDPAAGAACIAGLFDTYTPVLGGFGPMPYARIGDIHGDPIDPMPSHEAFALLDALPEDAVERFLDLVGPDADCALPLVELRRLGGAVARTGGGVAGAMCHRDAAYCLFAVGIDAPPIAVVGRAHAARLVAALAPFGRGGTWPNFAPSRTPEDVQRTYTPDVLARLATLVAHYDPRGVLRDAAAIRNACLSAV